MKKWKKMSNFSLLFSYVTCFKEKKIRFLMMCKLPHVTIQKNKDGCALKKKKQMNKMLLQNKENYFRFKPFNFQIHISTTVLAGEF